jgi:hypothetical protein
MPLNVSEMDPNEWIVYQSAPEDGDEPEPSDDDLDDDDEFEDAEDGDDEDGDDEAEAE